ncbi:glycosyltransferase [Bizionia sp.]|uniref:glycosyltransferase n=1 Tax=Bizionia sp. TaxID=1954480 RepID=UPI003A90D373
MKTINEKIEIVKSSGLLQASKYIEKRGLSSDLNIDDVVSDFLTTGENLNINPNPLFITKWYRSKNKISDSESPLIHYIESCKNKKYSNPNPLFFTEWYLNNNEDVFDSGLNPLFHYLEFGEGEYRKPNPYFDPEFYDKKHPSVKKSKFFLLEHHINFEKSNLPPSDFFDCAWYRHQYMKKSDNRLALIHYHEEGFKYASLLKPGFDIKYYEEIFGYKFDVNDNENFLECLLRNREKHKSINVYNNIIRPKDMNNLIVDGYPRLQSLLEDNIKDEILREDDNVFFSIVMPNYNRKDLISDAIVSVLNQSYKNFELIIVDDCSTDGSIEYIKEEFSEQINLGKIKLVEMPINGGSSKARNKGLSLAEGDAICYLDSDNYWYPDTLKLYRYALKDINVYNVYTPIYAINELSNDVNVIGGKFNRHNLLKQNYIDMNGFCHRREVYDVIGGFSEEMSRLVDWELILRYTKTFVTKYIPIVSTYYRTAHDSHPSITAQESLEENYEIVQQKHAKELVRNNILSHKKLAKFFLDGKLSYESPLEGRENSSILIALDYSNLDEIKEFDLKYNFEKKFLIVRSKKFYEYKDGCLNEVSLDKVDFDICYYPTSLKNSLPENTLYQAILSMSFESLNFSIVSNGLDKLPRIKVRRLRDSMVFDKEVSFNFLINYDLSEAYRGKVLNLLYDNSYIGKGDIIDSVLPNKFNMNYQTGILSRQETNSFDVYEEKEYTKPCMDFLDANKETVLFLGMKVAVGGVERLTIDLAKEFRREFNVAYLSLEKVSVNNGSLHEEIKDNFDCFWEANELVDRRDYLKFLTYINESVNPKYILFTNGSVWLANNFNKVRKIFKDSIIIDNQCYDHDAGWINKLREGRMLQSDGFVAVNKEIESVFNNELNFAKDKFKYISHGVNFNNADKSLRLKRAGLLDKYSLPTDRKILAFVGRLTDQKNPILYLELVKHYQNNTGLHFVLVGNGDLKDECKTFIKENNLSNITIIERVENISEFYVSIDGLVITSNYEGLPLALIEAIYMGVPALSTDVGEIRDTLEEFSAGIICDNNDVDTFVEKLDEFVKNLPKLKKNLINRRSKIYRKFSTSEVSKKYISFFKSLNKA